MLEILDETADELVAFRVSGKLLHDETHKIADMVDARIEAYGHARCFVEIDHSEGCELSALKEGIEFDLKHGNQIQRCAVIADQVWERWLIEVLSLFFRDADVRFFGAGDRVAALEWVRGS